MNTAPETLLDLKYLLRESKQRIPPFLESIEDPNAGQGRAIGCQNCGGLGHSISNCPKLEDSQRRQMASQRAIQNGGNY